MVTLKSPPIAGSWQVRLIEALQGNQSLPGCILIAALGQSRDAEGFPRRPSFGSHGIITAGGLLMSKMVDRNGEYRGYQGIAPVAEVIDHFKRYADQLKLKDAEREALFQELRRWIRYDYRQHQKPDEFAPVGKPH